jgi:hypothetical protein
MKEEKPMLDAEEGTPVGRALYAPATSDESRDPFSRRGTRPPGTRNNRRWCGEYSHQTQ